MTNEFNLQKAQFNPRSYWEQRLARHHGLTGVGYSSLGEYYNRWLYRLRRIIFARHVVRLNSDWRHQDVLDIGSGTGFYIELWKGLGVRSLQGCDITEIAVNRLKRTFPDCEFLQLDITQPDVLPPDAFDVVTAFDVLFHVVEDAGFKQAIKNIQATLKPGGVFIFSDNFLHGETIRAGHQVCRSLSEIESMLALMGFTVERRAPVFVTMNAPFDTSNRLYKWLWKQMSRLVSRSEIIGYVIGAALFALDWTLTGALQESPTTELMICRNGIKSEDRSLISSQTLRDMRPA